MRKLFLLLSLFTVMILSCGTEGKQGGETSSNKEGKRKFKIGITQIVASLLHAFLTMGEKPA